MKNVIIAGAAPNTGNLGVSALCRSAISELKKRDAELSLTALCYGDDFIDDGYQIDDKNFCGLMGVSNGKKLYKSNHYRNIELACKLGGSWNKRADSFLNSSAVLDISGGDSFTDLYGRRRFNGVFFPKKIAMKNNIPLILMPQTLGPFIRKSSVDKVIDVLKYSQLSYFRDSQSFKYAKDLMGRGFDSTRIKLGVDMAFLLKPNAGFCCSLEDEIGINVSGLLYNNQSKKDGFNIKADYKSVLVQFIEKLCKEATGGIVLIPHVISQYSNECDYKASIALKESLSAKYQDRVRVQVVDKDYDETVAKKIISNLEWFCGMRMHSTIAALSTCVPVANIAYSDKSYGVFETVGQEKMVFDARYLTTERIVDLLLDSWRRRDEIKGQLLQRVPEVKLKAQEQIKDIYKRI
jgi:polysaccharide pyruvyl transferase WcaK-like protein